MTLVRYEPWTLMNRLHRELDDLFRDPVAAQKAGTESRPVALLPSVDVHEDADRYVLRADLPGVQPADIQVTADQGVLTIHAERRVERREGENPAAAATSASPAPSRAASRCPRMRTPTRSARAARTACSSSRSRSR
jgi:HSP20 family molecular chaperone IbpA